MFFSCISLEAIMLADAWGTELGIPELLVGDGAAE